MTEVSAPEHTDDGLAEAGAEMPELDHSANVGEDLADLAHREMAPAPDLEVGVDGTDPTADPQDPGPDPWANLTEAGPAPDDPAPEG